MGNFIEFDAAAIRELAQILRETDLTEIELVDGESRLRLVRQPAVVAAVPAATQVTVAAPAAAPVTVTTSQAAIPDVMDADHPGAVTSPMVGVAYLSPEPGAAPFVMVGSKVVQGQTLLLIEAMKTFNQIKAHRSGTIARIMVADGTPVEYAEVLLLIE